MKFLEDLSSSCSHTNDSDEAPVDVVDRQENNAIPWLRKSNELTEFISHTNGYSGDVDGQQDNTLEAVSQDGAEQGLGTLSKITTTFNPCSPEGFSQTYFPKGGVVATPPLDYQYWRSYNPKFTTSV